MSHRIEITERSIADLLPYASNARTHSDAQVAQIAASITEFGWTNPVLVDDAGVLIAGHGRVLAARKLGLAAVPAIRLEHLTEAQARAYRLADNKLALNAGWDQDLLRLELADLQAIGADLGLIGFGDDELANILAEKTDGLTDPDEVPEVEAQAVSALGDVWLLGRHRLACGDCTDPQTVANALLDVKPHIMVTDPPYGVNYDPAWRNQAGVNNSKRLGVVENDDRADWREAWALFAGDVAYVWHGALQAPSLAESLIASGFDIRNHIIWAKDNLVFGRGHYHSQHESLWYAVRKAATGHWAGDHKQTTLWKIATRGQDVETVHGTQKPVECMKRPIENNSSSGQAVYEPFSGSGTTIIAAEITGRCCHAIELSPVYVDVAVRRWEQFTGGVATLEKTGLSFAEVAKQQGEAANGTAA